jgi:hypothetical protein
MAFPRNEIKITLHLGTTSDFFAIHARTLLQTAKLEFRYGNGVKADFKSSRLKGKFKGRWTSSLMKCSSICS